MRFRRREQGGGLGLASGGDGLWYLDRKTAMLVMNGGLEEEAMFQHRKLGHLSFDSLDKLDPELLNKVDRNKLVCDACEL